MMPCKSCGKDSGKFYEGSCPGCLVERVRELEAEVSVVREALDLLAPGVEGYMMDMGDLGVYIPVIFSTERGKGNVGRFLDELKQRPLVKIPNVISPHLAQMLGRRGFVVDQEWSEEDKRHIPVWVWRCAL